MLTEEDKIAYVTAALDWGVECHVVEEGFRCGSKAEYIIWTDYGDEPWLLCSRCVHNHRLILRKILHIGTGKVVKDKAR
jgi:hypothetical protein